MTVEGKWYNELGSTMTVTVATDGTVTGTYQTAVSGSNCALGTFGLSGRVKPGGASPVNVGFAVSWENDRSACNAVTAWSGEYRVVNLTDGRQVEIIKTTWLLTLETSQQDDWKSTLVGQDIFTRTLPEPPQLEKARAMKRLSHPTKPRRGA